MFERFTQQARDVVVGAQQVARATTSRSIDTRHILVALGEGTGPSARALSEAGLDVDAFTTALRAELTAGLDPEALASLGIDLARVRERTDAVFGSGALDGAGHSPGHLPFTRDAKKALELALREAVRLRHKSIDTRHLLLGILRADCPGRKALVARGVDPSSLRQAMEGDEVSGPRSA